PRQTFPAKISRINPMVDSSSRTFQVEAAVPNDDGLLRPGGFAKAQIITRRDAEALVVPREAVYRFAGVIKLFVVEGEKARGIPITTDLEGRGWVEVRGDLPARAQVITTGQTQLADGTSVVIRTPDVQANKHDKAKLKDSDKPAEPKVPASAKKTGL
ncbi:MAG: efflux RND transporter periplasmic adaptor subunit, partial [Isosphaeraceae bacterium]